MACYGQFLRRSQQKRAPLLIAGNERNGQRSCSDRSRRRARSIEDTGNVRYGFERNGKGVWVDVIDVGIEHARLAVACRVCQLEIKAPGIEVSGRQAEVAR